MNQVKLGGYSNSLALYSSNYSYMYATLGEYSYSAQGLGYEVIEFSQTYWPTDGGNVTRQNQFRIYSLDTTTTYPGPDPSWNRHITSEGNSIYWRKNPNYQYYDDLIKSIVNGQYTDSQEQQIRKWMKFGYVPDVSLSTDVVAYPKSVTYGLPYYFCKLAQDENPICNQVAVSIAPQALNQSVYINDPININIIVNYLDGSQRVIQSNCGFASTTVGNNQVATMTYSGLVGNAKTNSSLTTSSYINILPKLKSIKVTPSATTVYNGTKPTFAVVAEYMDGTTRPLSEGQYTYTGWTQGFGDKYLEFTYTESSKTVKANLVIIVKPNLSGLSLTASSTTVYYGDTITFTAKAIYENGSTITVGANCTQAYNSNLLGSQNISYSFTENGITKTASISVIVRD